jgi:hypothetical protein
VLNVMYNGLERGTAGMMKSRLSRGFQNHIGLRLLGALACLALVLCGCEDGSGGDGNSSRDNTVFYGRLQGQLTGEGPGSSSGGSTTFTQVHGDTNRRDSGDGMYIPPAGSSESWSFAYPGEPPLTVSVKVSGQVVSWHFEGQNAEDGKGTMDTTFRYADDYSSAEVSRKGTSSVHGSFSDSGTLTRF